MLGSWGNLQKRAHDNPQLPTKNIHIYIYMFRERVVNQCSAARGKVTNWRRENNEMKITRPGIIQKMPWEITLSFDQNSFCYVHRWPISWLRTDRKGEITWSLRSTTVQKTSSKKSNYSFITQNEVQWMCKPHSPEDVLQCGKMTRTLTLEPNYWSCIWKWKIVSGWE